MTPRPSGPGLYATIHLPRTTRVDDLRATHTHGHPLAAQPDPEEPLAMRLPRDMGPTPAQVARALDRRLVSWKGKDGVAHAVPHVRPASQWPLEKLERILAAIGVRR